jgi:hypothetical protein
LSPAHDDADAKRRAFADAAAIELDVENFGQELCQLVTIIVREGGDQTLCGKRAIGRWEPQVSTTGGEHTLVRRASRSTDHCESAVRYELTHKAHGGSLPVGHRPLRRDGAFSERLATGNAR